MASRPPPPPEFLRSSLARFPKAPAADLRSSIPAPSLPSLRLLLYPTPGLGFDARLPLSNPFRCFLSLESYFNGTSQIRIGLESNHLPFLRLEVVPSATLSIRPAALRISALKFGLLGASFTAYNAGRYPDVDFTSLPSFWQSIRPFVRPVVEITHRNTLLGALIQPQQRQAIHNVISDFKLKREKFPDRLLSSRDAILKKFQQRSMPPLDPRQPTDPNENMKERLKHQIERLSDPSSIQKPGRSFWPDHTLVPPDEQPAPPDSGEDTAEPASGDSGNSSVLGHVEEGKDGRLTLKRFDANGTSPLDDGVLNEMDERGPLFLLRHRLFSPFSRRGK